MKAVWLGMMTVGFGCSALSTVADNLTAPGTAGAEVVGGLVQSAAEASGMSAPQAAGLATGTTALVGLILDSVLTKRKEKRKRTEIHERINKIAS